MIVTGKDILIRLQKRWQIRLWLEIFLYALGPAVFVAFLVSNVLWAVGAFIAVAFIMALQIKPWGISLETVSRYIDHRLEKAEYSSGLLLLPENQLSGLARLQQQKVSNQITEQKNQVKPESNLGRAVIIATSLTVISLLLFQFNIVHNFKPSPQETEQQEKIIFRPVDSISTETVPPVLESQQVTINYPAYTDIATFTTSKMDIKAVEGSRLTWKLRFDGQVDSVRMESMGNSYPMSLDKGIYTSTSVLRGSGFYNFRFTDTIGRSYASNLYSIEVTKDRGPVIEISGLQQFTSFEVVDEKQLNFRSHISDDFGIGDAYIIATVSRGTGESVKFREEKLTFNGVESGSRNLDLSTKIDLDELKMEPGDELYFYVEALDLKQPKPNVTRSETYFAVIKDTVSNLFEVEGSLGVDLMPAYFRSQRQLIIDTEKLIAERHTLPTKKFNATSNDLGFDQKALRLKYGEFMGDESEGGGGGTIQNNEETGKEAEDPLAKYTHDHDGDNEHNLVEEDHAEHAEEEETEDPLGEYLHNHDDPEESTLFTDNLKSKLRQALDIMWDAELHLRMYEPEKSLPYQYRALAFIQEIKNSARIYVHRIGYDPPPIKEEVRLTGEIEEVSNYQKIEELREPDVYPELKQAVLRLEQLMAENAAVTEEDRQLFEKAGTELAARAIEEPGKYLNTLQQLKWLTEDVKTSPAIMAEVKRGLLLAIPGAKPTPGRDKSFTGQLDELLLKELELNDR